MRPGALMRLAFAGTRTDTLRVILTGVSAALATVALLAAATVLATPDVPGRYSSELLGDNRLRTGVAMGLLLLTIPVLALAAACSRLGAPEREQRLSALRLAGATPAQVRHVAAAETGMASAGGVLCGLIAYMVVMLAVAYDENGQLPLPVDVRLPAWLIAALCLVVPATATALAMLTLRRVTVGPFGVVRRGPRGRPRPWPMILLVLGVAAYLPLEALAWAPGNWSWLDPLLIFGGGLVASIGVALSVGWISYAAGRVLHRYARRPATLIAARRLLTDPWSGARTFGALVVAVLVAAGATAFRAVFVAEARILYEAARPVLAAAGEHNVVPDFVSDFYTRTLDAVTLGASVAAMIAAAAMLVFLAEGVVSGRRANAALVATGVPRRTLAKATLWQAALPAAPAIALAVAVGALMTRAFQDTVSVAGQTVAVCRNGPVERVLCHPGSAPELVVRELWVPGVTNTVPVPWADLAVVAGGAMALVLAVAGLSLTLLRSATDLGEIRTA